jgi:hypothetical protein
MDAIPSTLIDVPEKEIAPPLSSMKSIEDFNEIIGFDLRNESDNYDKLPSMRESLSRRGSIKDYEKSLNMNPNPDPNPDPKPNPNLNPNPNPNPNKNHDSSNPIVVLTWPTLLFSRTMRINVKCPSKSPEIKRGTSKIDVEDGEEEEESEEEEKEEEEEEEEDSIFSVNLALKVVMKDIAEYVTEKPLLLVSLWQQGPATGVIAYDPLR